MRPHGTRESKTRSGAGPEEPTAGTEGGREGRRGRWRRSRHAGDAKLNEAPTDRASPQQRRGFEGPFISNLITAFKNDHLISSHLNSKLCGGGEHSLLRTPAQ